MSGNIPRVRLPSTAGARAARVMAKWPALGLLGAMGVVACGSADGAKGGDGGEGGSAGGGASAGRAGSSSSSGAGGGNAGEPGNAGASAGAANGGSGTSGAGGGRQLGEFCTPDCTLSPCATPSTVCASGFCVFESLFEPNKSYCTLACDGVGEACPGGYGCQEDERQAGTFWCVKAEPTTPSDFGEACDATFNASSCLATDTARECTIRGQGCDEWCVRGPGGAPAHCSVACSVSLPCPSGYDCRDNPIGATSESVCFRAYTPEEVAGDACERDPQLVPLCGTNPPSCVAPDRYGLCACVHDVRGPDALDYCSLPCSSSDCPAGFECVATSGTPGETPAGTYCLALP